MLRSAAALALLAAVAAGGAAPPATAQEWRVAPAPSDNPRLMAATIRNDDGHTVYVWRLEDEGGSHVFCELHLADGMGFADAMPLFRIDDAAAVDTAEIRDAGDEQNALWGHVGDTVAFWLVTSRDGQVRADDPSLRPWLAGEKLEITFRSADGALRTTRFSLAGSGDAIRSATGLAAR